MEKLRKAIFCLIVMLASLCAFLICPLPAEEAPANPYGIRSSNPYAVERFMQNGKSIDRVIVPGPPNPPPGFIRPEVATLPVPNPAAGVNVLANVPASTWAFGCSATSAAMMYGYYDNLTYTNMYAGPTNGGVYPMTNATWGSALINGETRYLNPLSATRDNLDGRTIYGHVDDYWIKYLNAAADPFITGGWAEHTKGECTGDYMGTNQSTFSNSDGSTTFYYYTDGNPLYNYTGAEPAKIDGCHGMKDFVESRGYTVQTLGNFNQYIYGYIGNTLGFTFANFKAEIDAGRPVLIQVEGHTMLGFGYDDTGTTVYIHDTWDHLDHTMTWGGSYSGMVHYGVTVFRLSAVSTYTISGTILLEGSPLEGVVMSGLPGDPTTNASGYYAGTVNYNWSGTVTPTLAGYEFTPENRTYSNVAGNQTGQDYTALAPSLDLTNPNGGEHWTIGTTKNITWEATNYTGTVRLVLFKAGVRFGNIATGLSASAGSYTWTVGNTIDGGTATEGSDYRLYLRSTDNTLVDPSDYRFSLINSAQLHVTSPNGGESWALGSQHAITWTAGGYSGNVRLILFQKAAKVGQIVTNLPASQGNYNWTVGSYSGGTATAGILYSIRLQATDGSQDDFSDGPLTITSGGGLVVDHLNTDLKEVPEEWLARARLRQRLLVAGPGKNDPAVLGLRLLGSREPRLGVAMAGHAGSGLGLQEATWQPGGMIFDLVEWRWSLERSALESDASVMVVRPDEAALRFGRLDAAGYLSVLRELAERLPGVTLVCSTVGMDEPDGLVERFNREVREHVLQSKGVLLDTADIESWRNGRQALKGEFAVRHPAYRGNEGMPSEENLANQGAAAWWLLARLSGWPGSEPPPEK